MEHLIRFRTAEGVDGTHLADTLTDAVAFIERLRNAEGATDVHLFRLTEVPLEFKPYYRVEVAGLSERGADPLPTNRPPTDGGSVASTSSASSTPVRDPAPPLPVNHPEPAAANGRKLFTRG